MYANVILPLKIERTMSYKVPKPMEKAICEGSRVTVTLHGRKYLCVTDSVTYTAPAGIDPAKIKEIDSVEDLTPVSRFEMRFWKTIADYYMCTVGEVFKAAYSGSFSKQIEYLARQRQEDGEESAVDRMMREEAEKAEMSKIATNLPTLSKQQEEAVKNAENAFAEGKTVLLNGVTGSGKTEVYVTLAARRMQQGKSVLYMVPEIAMSRQLCTRLKKVFGESLMIFHSQQTPARKKRIFDTLENEPDRPVIILGTRSSVFLPVGNPGLIIVDEEHDPSYKQDDPAPRYNGRDAALMLGEQCGTAVILGSATPSMESLFNVKRGRFAEVRLTEKYYGEEEPEIEIVDTIQARKLHDMTGSISNRLRNEIAQCLKKKEQVMVFRSRRSYAPFIQCSECGEILKCPNCEVNLSYHKYNDTVSCHYCDYTSRFTTTCPYCGKEALVLKGAGTEKIEEELRNLFPDAVIDRFDADIFKSKTKSDTVLNDFAEGKTDILVGTQMVAKGFDFENLALVAVISGDSILSFQDFRNDERAMDLLSQLRGRAGRRKTRGRMLIQTDHSAHPVFATLSDGTSPAERIDAMMEERRIFNYPPFSRMLKIIVRDEYEGRLGRTVDAIADALRDIPEVSFTGPVQPELSRLKGLYISEIWIKLPRSSKLGAMKRGVAAAMESVRKQMDFATDIYPDVDPQ